MRQRTLDKKVDWCEFCSAVDAGACISLRKGGVGTAFVMVLGFASMGFETKADEIIPIRCFEVAGSLNLTFHQRLLLCTNATSLHPVACFREVFQPLTPDQRINLCQGASSSAPNECFDESFDLFLSFDQRTKLCSGAAFRSDEDANHHVLATAPAFCYRKALKIPLSQDQRIILCASASSDEPVRCFLRSDELGISPDQRVRLCTQLAPSSW